MSGYGRPQEYCIPLFASEGRWLCMVGHQERASVGIVRRLPSLYSRSIACSAALQSDYIYIYNIYI